MSGIHFVWIRGKHGSGEPEPQIVFDGGVGPKLDILASRPLAPGEDRLTLAELAVRYPAPSTTPGE